MEKATVIINTYKENPDYLRLAIESYLQQTDIEMQIIISSVKGDTSLRIAREYYNIDLCISPEPGIYEQLNNAVKKIKGDWFSIASGNDVAIPYKTRMEIDCCKAENKKVCYSAFLVSDEDFKHTDVARFHDYDYQKHLVGNFVNDDAIIHKSLLKYLPFKLKWGNHAIWDYWLRIYEKEGNVFCYNPIPTWKYRMSKDSAHIKRKSDPEKHKHNIDLRNKMLNSHK